MKRSVETAYEDDFMKKSNVKNTIATILGFVLVLSCVIVLIVNFTDVTVHGSMDSAAVTIGDDHAGEELDNYDLIVIEDEELPAAAAPEESKAGNALWVIAIVSVLVILIAYELWYESCNLRIKYLAVESGEENLQKGIGRLHPFKAIDARRDLEIRAAENYFK